MGLPLPITIGGCIVEGFLEWLPLAEAGLMGTAFEVCPFTGEADTGLPFWADEAVEVLAATAAVLLVPDAISGDETGFLFAPAAEA